jgi:ubiquinone/menaquinone biosynthesis C-methylase UbiE
MDQAAPSFAGSIPEMYQRYMVPLVFEHYASDLAGRVAHRARGDALELAAGTGVVTRKLASALPEEIALTVTDLSPAMLQFAKSQGTARDVTWQQADALALPFADASFDVVLCQFGVMFFPDKVKGFSEARRVLEPGGSFIFNVWDRIEENHFARVVMEAIAAQIPDQPPDFLARIPHGYYDDAQISHDLMEAGFAAPQIETIAARSRAESPAIVATAFCQATPLRNEIETRAPGRLQQITDMAAAALERQFGSGVIEAKMQARVIVVNR